MYIEGVKGEETDEGKHEVQVYAVINFNKSRKPIKTHLECDECLS